MDEATGQLDAKITHEESVALAAKIAAEKDANAKVIELKFGYNYHLYIF